MNLELTKIVIVFISLVLILRSSYVTGQDLSISEDKATVTYPALYFDQYESSDMLDRIPGINVARQENFNSQIGPGSSQGSDRRGLGRINIPI